jgi:hypothetical protein
MSLLAANVDSLLCRVRQVVADRVAVLSTEAPSCASMAGVRTGDNYGHRDSGGFTPGLSPGNGARRWERAGDYVRPRGRRRGATRGSWTGIPGRTGAPREADLLHRAQCHYRAPDRTPGLTLTERTLSAADRVERRWHGATLAMLPGLSPAVTLPVEDRRNEKPVAESNLSLRVPARVAA